MTRSTNACIKSKSDKNEKFHQLISATYFDLNNFMTNMFQKAFIADHYSWGALTVSLVLDMAYVAGLLNIVCLHGHHSSHFVRFSEAWDTD